MFKQISVVAALAAVFIATPASAAIVLTQGADFTLGENTNWMSDKPGSPPLANDTGFAGAYRVRIGNTVAAANAAPVTQVFCIDLFLGINTNNVQYTQDQVSPNSPTLADMTRVSRAAWIFSDVFPRIAALAAANSTNVETIAVALQFAMWETMVDNSNDLSAGAFRRAAGGVAGSDVVGTNYEKAITLATSFTNRLATNYSASVAANSVILIDTGFNRAVPGQVGNVQGLIYYNPAIPEPSTFLLFGSALAALGIVTRRRKA